MLEKMEESGEKLVSTELASAARLLNRAASRLSSTAVSGTAAPVGDELKSLFPHHFGERNNVISPSIADRSCGRGRSKRRIGTPKKKEIVRRFVCLADKKQVESPDAEQHRLLLMSGLGELKLSIPEDANEQSIRAVLLSNFPKLAMADGFDFMYVETRCRDMKVIPPGPYGITMRYLVSFVGQGKVFLRPTKESLPLAPSYKHSRYGASTEHTNNGTNCLEVLGAHRLKEHSINCSVPQGEQLQQIMH